MTIHVNDESKDQLAEFGLIEKIAQIVKFANCVHDTVRKMESLKQFGITAEMLASMADINKKLIPQSKAIPLLYNIGAAIVNAATKSCQTAEEIEAYAFLDGLIQTDFFDMALRVRGFVSVEGELPEKLSDKRLYCRDLGHFLAKLKAQFHDDAVQLKSAKKVSVPKEKPESQKNLHSPVALGTVEQLRQLLGCSKSEVRRLRAAGPGAIEAALEAKRQADAKAAEEAAEAARLAAEQQATSTTEVVPS